MTPEEYAILKTTLDKAFELTAIIGNLDKTIKKIDTAGGIAHIESLISNGLLDFLPDNFISSLLSSLILEAEKAKKDLEKELTDL